MKLILTLTSTKESLKYITPVLQSWLSQTKQLDKIYISLSAKEFPELEKSLPRKIKEFLSSEPSVSIIWNSKKIFNRLLPVIKNCDDDDLIVFTNDNIIFRKNYLEVLYSEFLNDSTKPLQPRGNTFDILNKNGISLTRVYLNPGFIIRKSMLNNCEKLLTEQIFNLNAEYLFYSCVLWLGGYLINQLKSDLSYYSHTFNLIENSNTFVTEDTIKRCIDLLKWQVLKTYHKNSQFKLFNSTLYEETGSLPLIDDKSLSIKKEKEPIKMSKQQYMIFYDRGYRAQDNAEHLCRWVMKNHPEIKTAYLLEKSSYDWSRLAKDNFNLIDLLDRHTVREELLKCDYACSSIFNEGIWLDFNYCHCKRIFLNHGCFLVPINYIKNEKDNIDLFIAANTIEYNTFLDPYHKLDANQVALCGQPRQDELIKSQKKPHTEDTILIQFWQRPVKWTENNNKQFLESDFYKKTSALLSNAQLLDTCKKHKLKIVFKMHSIQYDWLKYYSKYENQFVHISPLSELFEPIFIKSKFIITDISSNAYEMAKIGKPCIYFEPDFNELFSWRHKKNGGFEFDLAKNSIGPLILGSVDSIVNEIQKLIKSNYVLDKTYLSRRKSQISFVNDEHSCERCFEAIVKTRVSRTEQKTKDQLKKDEENKKNSKNKKDFWFRVM